LVLSRALACTALLGRSFLWTCLGSTGGGSLSFTDPGLLVVLGFTPPLRRGEEAGEGFIEEWPVLLFFYQASGEGFAQQLAFEADRSHGLHRVHALTHGDAETSSAQIVNEVQGNGTHTQQSAFSKSVERTSASNFHQPRLYSSRNTSRYVFPALSG
jgi:hypothetical protein